jgi:hypothetical protein
MPNILTDPALCLAVAGWLLLLVPTIAMCRAAARGDRMAERARRDVHERRQHRERTLTALNGMGQEIETNNVAWLFPERARRRGLAERVMDSDGLGAA